MIRRRAHARAIRSVTLAVFATAITLVVGCDAAATAVTMIDTVDVIDTVHRVDTIRTADTIHNIDSVERVSYYLVSFHGDSTTAGCSQTPCPIVPASSNFTGSITERSDSMFLVVGNYAYAPVPMTSVHLDSLPTTASVFSCELTLYMTATSNTLRGRWRQPAPCGGTTAFTGTLIATRQ